MNELQNQKQFVLFAIVQTDLIFKDHGRRKQSYFSWQFGKRP